MSEQTSETQTEPTTPNDAAVLHASGQSPNFSGLTWSAFRLEDQGCWSFGVVVAGAYVELARTKLGGTDDKIREAANPGFKAERADRYAREVLGQR